MSSSQMGLFRGWLMGWEIDEILTPDEVFSARDEEGRRYLFAHTEASTWLCAPISERALSCVASGQAELRAVFAHSSTGMVLRLTVGGMAVCGESLVPCAELLDDELPRPGVRLCWQARCA
ncbi:MAG: hypothetical protein QOF20_124 [Acidimicrobiaceae bacterium]|jgi:hypothetical protein|nr:hypothetical protein [Acidimicrobiaceae bacterium]MDQ1367771.1 hypothetical protein [Acidimicrobiaceae bacterium]MDQ1377971.1 hypothetical protein [Acidimicrobiaceae bacterium]MDQ1400551.1 hypothetical protein [Acidimicrobiaceae bacterium]MDQ1413081.1 hypothetical protein [Acidimicrobiaceae bacterium]